jgi:Ca2+-binding EF-hand superfamily protein
MAATHRHEQEMMRKCYEQSQKAEDPMEQLRLNCLSRGAAGIKGLGRVFRIMDDNGDKKLDFSEFKKGLKDYGVTLSDEKARQLFDQVDTDKNGSISFDEFLVKLRPPMNQARKSIVEKAFRKFDVTGDGQVTIDDVKRVYNAEKHPKYLNGEWTKDDVFRHFLVSFDSPYEPDGIVTLEEFFNYYSGVSASVDNDAYFDLMIRNAWKL